MSAFDCMFFVCYDECPRIKKWKEPVQFPSIKLNVETILFPLEEI
jgi:hypothetical protein